MFVGLDVHKETIDVSIAEGLNDPRSAIWNYWSQHPTRTDADD
jgi:hypothetical protein